jgi:hypothetical protein
MLSSSSFFQPHSQFFLFSLFFFLFLASDSFLFFFRFSTLFQSDDSEDEEDDAAFELYKQQRISSVQNSLPRFGSHTRVSKAEFATLAKEVHELCFVVCHLYQNVSCGVYACVRHSQLLRRAQSYGRRGGCEKRDV